MKKTFENFKNYILEKAEEHDACNKEYIRAKTANNFEELLAIIKDNANWCYLRDIINADILIQNVDGSILYDNGIYINQKIDNISGGDFLLFNSSVNKMYDTSSVKLMTGASSVNKMYDTSSVNKMTGTSSVNKMYDTSSVKLMTGASSVNKMYDTSSVNWMYDTSSVNKMYDTSSVNKMTGTSSVNKMYGTSSYRTFRFGENPKIYIKKSQFEIIEL